MSTVEQVNANFWAFLTYHAVQHGETAVTSPPCGPASMTIEQLEPGVWTVLTWAYDCAQPSLAEMQEYPVEAVATWFAAARPECRFCSQ